MKVRNAAPMKADMQTRANRGVVLHRIVRRVGVWKTRLDKRLTRRMRIYGLLCVVNDKIRTHHFSDPTTPEDRRFAEKWRRNSGRILKLNQRWFGDTPNEKGQR